jgi:hypothetical protein
MTRLFTLALVLAAASEVTAAPNVGQVTQKGSLLIFPDIDVRGSRTTLVRIENDGTRSAPVSCTWIDGNKNRIGFSTTLTRDQPFWFDAKTGRGTRSVGRFPLSPSNGFDNPHLPGGSGPYGAGLLVCYVTSGGRPAKWNHLSGTATVYDAQRGTAYEYSAYAIFVPVGNDLEPVAATSNLNLNGVEFDSCPFYQIGQFSPAGAQHDDLAVTANRLAIVGCNLDMRQDWLPVFTKLQFDVWNAEEVKFSGAFECADSWHETDFTGIDAGAQNFTFAALATNSARYRVQGVASTQCANSAAVGVLAVQSTSLLLGGRMDSQVGTTLAAAGKMTGRITRNGGGGGGPVPEGSIP